MCDTLGVVNGGKVLAGGAPGLVPRSPFNPPREEGVCVRDWGGGGGGGTVILVIEVLYKLDHDKLCACMSEVALYMCIMS